ncbi:MAG: hypothetical protein AAGA26_06545 [Pseudomonadota bacterium]
MIRQTVLAGAVAVAALGIGSGAQAIPATPVPVAQAEIAVEPVGFKKFGHRRGFRSGFRSRSFGNRFGFRKFRGFRGGVRSKVIIGDRFHGKGFISKGVPTKKIIGPDVIVIK